MLRRSLMKRRSQRRNPLANKLGKLFARQRKICRWLDRLAEVNLDFAPAGERVKPPGLRRDKLHVADEDRNDRHAGFPRDEIQASLAGSDVNTIATRAFRR